MMKTWYEESGSPLQNTLILNKIPVKIPIDKGDPEIHLEEQRDLNSWHNFEKEEGRGTCLLEKLGLTEPTITKAMWSCLRMNKYINGAGQRVQKQATICMKTWYMTKAALQSLQQVWVI